MDCVAKKMVTLFELMSCKRSAFTLIFKRDSIKSF